MKPEAGVKAGQVIWSRLELIVVDPETKERVGMLVHGAQMLRVLTSLLLAARKCKFGAFSDVKKSCLCHFPAMIL